MRHVVVRPAVILPMIVCALVGHLWMQPGSLSATEHPAAHDVQSGPHGQAPEDGTTAAHVMALSCMAVLSAGASLLLRTPFARITVASTGPPAVLERSGELLPRSPVPHVLGKDRIESGILLLI